MSYYISPRFLDKISVHITKNYLELPGLKVPLILGIHGRKGEGKSFQCELVFQQMGLEVIHMSAGELESPDAGDPARLIRLRYREAAEVSRVRGKMAVLMINDIDAGMGRVDQFTQYTVNTQLVAGTLMNIADNPTNVQLPGSYDAEPIQRIPIIVTGNDFSTLYAPLIRDGRMEKFYWEPDRADRIGIVNGIFEQDQLNRSDIEKLVDTFPEQSIDFYSALHARLYDEQIRKFIHQVGVDRVSTRVVNSAEKRPDFDKPDFNLSHLIELGQLMVREQQRIQELALVREYNTPPTKPQAVSGSPTQAVSDSPPSTPEPHYNKSGRSPQVSTNGNAASYPKKPVVPPNNHSEAYSVSYPKKPVTPPHHSEALRVLEQLLRQGFRVGIEYVDERRFRTNSWQCYAIIQDNSGEAVPMLEACLRDHAHDYIRLVGINVDRQRMTETIVQRPAHPARR